MDKITELLNKEITETIAREFPDLSEEHIKDIVEENIDRIVEPMWTEFDFRLSFLLTEIQQGAHEDTTITVDVED